jgi:hypothetical protein
MNIKTSDTDSSINNAMSEILAFISGTSFVMMTRNNSEIFEKLFSYSSELTFNVPEPDETDSEELSDFLTAAISLYSPFDLAPFGNEVYEIFPVLLIILQP